MTDAMIITILENGTIKVETGKVSGVNHMTAEAFMRELPLLCGGGKQERKHRHGPCGGLVHAVQHLTGRGH